MVAFWDLGTVGRKVCEKSKATILQFSATSDTASAKAVESTVSICWTQKPCREAVKVKLSNVTSVTRIKFVSAVVVCPGVSTPG